MSDPRVERLASLLVDYSLDVREGETVLVRAPLAAAPLARELHRAVLRRGGLPELRLDLPGAREALVERGTDAQLDWLNPTSLDLVEHVDCYVALIAPTNTRALAGSDPERSARLARASQPLLDRMLARSSADELRTMVTLFPTTAAAQEAGMSLRQYERFVYEACGVDRPDPAAYWRELAATVERVRARLEPVRELRVVGPGTELVLGVGGRTWVAADGRQNMPDGEIFTAPHVETVEGEIRFPFPALYGGRVLDDVRLRFERGEVVEARARRGEAFLREMLEVDDGARRAGEFAFGLNPGIQRATGETLFDEKIGGTVHLALGSAYPECGGTNESAIHWDLVCDLREGGEVHADGERIYRDGRFLDL